MSAPPPTGSADLLRWLGENWAKVIGEVLGGMSGEKAEVSWRAASGATGEDASGAAAHHWQQGFDLGEDAIAWAVLSEPAWQAMGARVLTAAGLEAPAAEEVHGTVHEILGQSLAGLAQNIGQRLGRPVSSRSGTESPKPPEALPAGVAAIRLAGVPIASLGLYFSPGLAGLLAESVPAQPAAEPGSPAEAQPDYPPSATLDLLRDLELPVSVSFGRTELPLHEVLKLAAGSVIELDRAVSDPVALIVNNTVVALGEVVVIEGNYGLRVCEIMSRDRLLRSSGLA